MYFLIDPSSEEKLASSDILWNDMKLFPKVMLTRNSCFFILDVLIKKPADEETAAWHSFYWRSFLVNSIDHVLSILEDDSIIDHKLSLFPERNDINQTDSCSIELIDEIIAGEDVEGNKAYVYVGKEGMRFLDSSTIRTEIDMVNKNTIYNYKKSVNLWTTTTFNSQRGLLRQE